jgi:hypothetical protein
MSTGLAEEFNKAGHSCFSPSLPFALNVRSRGFLSLWIRDTPDNIWDAKGSQSGIQSLLKTSNFLYFLFGKYRVRFTSKPVPNTTTTLVLLPFKHWYNMLPVILYLVSVKRKKPRGRLSWRKLTIEINLVKVTYEGTSAIRTMWSPHVRNPNMSE